jgi:PAS domain S-box-containing protein
MTGPSPPTDPSASDALLTPEEFEAVLGLLPVGVALADEAGRCTYWSPSARHLLGHPPERLLGRPIAEALYPPGQKPPPEFTIGEARGVPRDLVLLQADGRHLHVRERIVRILGPGPGRGFLITYEDTTDLTHQLERLALIHTLSDLVQGTLKLDRLLHVVLTCATAGAALSFNRAFLLLVDEDEKVLRGAMGAGPMSREEASHVWTALERESLPIDVLVERYFLAGGSHDSRLDQLTREIRVPLGDEHHPLIRALRAEHPLVFRGEEAHRARARVLPPELPASSEFVVAPFIARDRPVGALLADNLFDEVPITAEDVSSLSMLAGIAGLAIANARMYQSERDKTRRLQEALEDLRLAQERLLLSERLAVIGRLSAHLAHEIRNPLTTIGLYVRAIEKHWDGGDLNRRKLEVALDEVGHLEEILNAVLDFARPRSPVFGECDLAALLEDIHRAIAQEAESLDVRTDVSCEPGIAFRADSAQMRQVLLNLTRNALQVMTEGGYLRIVGQRKGDRLVIRVTDTGPGISEENLERIFEPFFTTQVKGSGLGLAICRKIVEDHEGRIEVQSALGRGTTFTVTQPLHPRAPRAPAAPRSERSEEGK